MDTVCQLEPSCVFELVVIAFFILATVAAIISVPIDGEHCGYVNQKLIEYCPPLPIVLKAYAWISSGVDQFYIKHLLLDLWVYHNQFIASFYFSHSNRSTPISRASHFHFLWKVVNVVF